MTPDQRKRLETKCASITSLEELDAFRDGLREQSEFTGPIVALVTEREKTLFRREPVKPLRRRGAR